MEIHKDLDRLPAFKNAAITTGTFDGVHAGHLKIIQQLKEAAQKENGESVLVTFHPHPRLVLQKDSKLQLLNSFEEKMELLEKQGIDHVVVVEFTKEFSDTLPEKYISDFLVGKLHAKSIITGYDHRFGKGRKGDYKLLEKLSTIYGYSVHEIPAYVLEEITISSTKIREALSSGDILTANECLGYDYFLEGAVVKGNQIGRTLGFPTANIKVADPHKLIPRYGIYAIEATLPDEENGAVYRGMMSIGIRPTITDNREAIEANLFDFDKDLYGQKLRIRFKKYIRAEEKFDSIEALAVKIHEDESVIREWFRSR
ncbi:MAG: bifunctional riboflavin kinase/FAD synthetase [Chitinophagaceae bacterium]|nr:bifunctional riboflavin kinase/FAD synthetase [Chitinophagaceae bacterium]